MSSEERVQRYAEALGASRVNYRLASLLTGDELETATRAVMDVADAEIRHAHAEALREAADLYPVRRDLQTQDYLRARADAIESDEETPA